MGRPEDLDRLYDLLDHLAERVDGPRRLANCHGRMDWPERGVYVFFAPDETRAESSQPRITRIGTHAVASDSGTTLWNRLITHRGTFSGNYEGGGNHRGSVFRLRVGEAMLERDGLTQEFPKWGKGSSAGRELRKQELEHEQRVSEYIRQLPFLWIRVNDEPGSNSRRANIERNMIALVSNFESRTIDERASSWLGWDSPNRRISLSGLWNVEHVGEEYDPEFLDVLATHIDRTGAV